MDTYLKNSTLDISHNKTEPLTWSGTLNESQKTFLISLLISTGPFLVVITFILILFGILTRIFSCHKQYRRRRKEKHVKLLQNYLMLITESIDENEKYTLREKAFIHAAINRRTRMKGPVLPIMQHTKKILKGKRISLKQKSLPKNIIETNNASVSDDPSLLTEAVKSVNRFLKDEYRMRNLSYSSSRLSDQGATESNQSTVRVPYCYNTKVDPNDESKISTLQREFATAEPRVKYFICDKI